MSLLIAVKSNAANLKAGKHEQIRGTWAKEFAGKADIRFFIGDALANFGRTFIQTQRDELTLPVSDLAEGDVLKVRTIAQHFLGKVYDHLLIIDADSLYYPIAKILRSGYERFDYSGFVPLGRVQSAETFPYVDPMTDEFYSAVYPWVEAQTGIFLSREAAAVVVNEIPREKSYEMFISRVLGPEIFRAHLLAENLNLRECSVLTAQAF